MRVVETHAFRLGSTIVALRNEFGWKWQMIAVLMEDAFAGRCPCCGRPYRSIQDGKPRVLTLDIIIPSEPPCWTNTRFICIECNVIKGKKTGQELFNALEDRKRYFSEPSPKDPQMDFLDPVYQEKLLDKELNANKLERYVQSPLTAIEPQREQMKLF